VISEWADAPAGLGGFQMVLTHEDGRDQLTVRVAVTDPEAVDAAASQDLEARLFAARPLLAQIIRSGKALPLQVEWLRSSELAVNPRTGKLRRVVELRR